MQSGSRSLAASTLLEQPHNRQEAEIWSWLSLSFLMLTSLVVAFGLASASAFVPSSSFVARAAVRPKCQARPRHRRPLLLCAQTESPSLSRGNYNYQAEHSTLRPRPQRVLRQAALLNGAPAPSSRLRGQVASQAARRCSHTHACPPLSLPCAHILAIAGDRDAREGLGGADHAARIVLVPGVRDRRDRRQIGRSVPGCRAL